MSKVTIELNRDGTSDSEAELQATLKGPLLANVIWRIQNELLRKHAKHGDLNESQRELLDTIREEISELVEETVGDIDLLTY